MNRKFLSDGVVELRLKRIERKLFFPLAYNYDIYKYKTEIAIGRCDYRCLKNEENYYGGNIGYMIFADYRGHHYALAAARLLCQMAAWHTDELLITCSPENSASYKTIIELGGKLIAEVNVPKWHYLYAQGERIKYVFRIDLASFQLLE